MSKSATVRQKRSRLGRSSGWEVFLGIFGPPQNLLFTTTWVPSWAASDLLTQPQSSKVTSTVLIKMPSFMPSFFHPFMSQMLNIDICVSSSRKKDLFRWNGTMDHIIRVLRGNKPTTHFSEWLPIKQKDFAVHHRLNSGWNVINLYKP